MLFISIKKGRLGALLCVATKVAKYLGTDIIAVFQVGVFADITERTH